MSRRARIKILTVSVLAALGLGLSACGGEVGELEILDIQPRAGATAGEQPVRIVGRNFRQDISYTVYFGNRASERSTILDDQTLLVATPTMEEPAVVDVIIAADNGPAFRIAQGFHYEEMGGNVMENVGTTSGQGEERF